VSGTHPILDPGHRRILATMAHANVLVALDYDGTLAPIADRPEEAFMRPITRTLLAAVARRYPVVVISGRALADVEQMVGEIPVWFIYGNHGLESVKTTHPPPAEVRTWLPLLLPLTAEGVRIEDKGLSVTLHYRGAPDRARAMSAIEKVVATLQGATVMRGKEAVNLLPRGYGNKGVALADARRAFACDCAIYVGDEDTDEAAFAADTGGQTLAIRVEPSDQSRARYHLGSQRYIDDLLQTLLDARDRRTQVRG
jgi:trehalose 6-phosphate phosphatase